MLASTGIIIRDMTVHHHDRNGKRGGESHTVVRGSDIFVEIQARWTDHRQRASSVSVEVRPQRAGVGLSPRSRRETETGRWHRPWLDSRYRSDGRN